MEHSDNEHVEEEDEVTDDKRSEDGDSDGDDDVVLKYFQCHIFSIYSFLFQTFCQ